MVEHFLSLQIFVWVSANDLKKNSAESYWSRLSKKALFAGS